tara:strand:+ start:2581 stop:2997 length:417 start_codon:yes stop_codon:yes gene_type:complete
MKILKLTFLFSLIFLSCQSNDEDNTSLIIGKWRETSEIESGKDYTNECTPLNTLEIMEDGTAISTNYAHIVKGEEPYECVFEGKTESQWVINGSIITVTIIEDGESLENESIFTIENDILTIKNKPENEPIIVTYRRI